jgi:secondary thiamine-phosphate synthase enzyme
MKSRIVIDLDATPGPPAGRADRIDRMVHRLELATGQREELCDVTDRVAAEIARGEIREGICLVFSPHTTCGVMVNEGFDPDVQTDVLGHLRELVPEHAGWRHAEGNSDAHMKSILVGASVTLPIEAGALRLGRWQRVFLCEFDGPRARQLWVSVQGGVDGGVDA